MLPRHVKYYNSQADLGRRFLHPGGKWASEKLLSMIPGLNEKSRVLEIGCGLGHTANILLAQSPCSYFGVDASPSMLKNAHELLSTFGNRVILHECDLKKTSLPVESEYLDVMYAESVVAIIDPRKVMREAHRVLKKGGTVLINDRIWSESVTIDERKKFNSIGQSLYGFPFASDDPGTAREWKEAFAASGFICTFAERLSFENVLGNDYRLEDLSRWEKLRRGLRKPGILLQLYRDRKIATSLAHVWGNMEPWLFVARKD